MTASRPRVCSDDQFDDQFSGQVADGLPGGCDGGPVTGDRVSGESGSGLVAGIALIFAFTFLGLVWLARDVDRGVSNRSTAGSVAFQSARSGAQAAFPESLRSGQEPTIDAVSAQAAGAATAARLFAAYDVTGTVALTVTADHVTAVVTITDRGVTVTGRAVVQSQRAP